MKSIKEAQFAGGCFWCVESDFRKLDGLIDIVSGYSGEGKNPTYDNHQGFVESVKIIYDENIISFKKLCQFFLDHIDPTDSDGQFFDRGDSYKSIIFYKDENEKKVATNLLKELEESKLFDKPIAVKISEIKLFFPAEDYHQRYSEKNPVHYNSYKRASGREVFQNRICKIRDEKHINWAD